MIRRLRRTFAGALRSGLGDDFAQDENPVNALADLRLTAPLLDLTGLNAPPAHPLHIVEGIGAATPTFWSGMRYIPPPEGGWIQLLGNFNAVSGPGAPQDWLVAVRAVGNAQVTMAVALAPPDEQVDTLPLRGSFLDGLTFGGGGPSTFLPAIRANFGEPLKLPPMFVPGGRAIQVTNLAVNTFFGCTALLWEPIQGGGR